MVSEFGHDEGRTSFEVLPWSLSERSLTLRWSGGGRVFEERYEFPGTVPTDEWVTCVVDLLAVVASVSYAKASAPAVVTAPSIEFTTAGRTMVESAFGAGMAEFSLETGIDDPIVLSPPSRQADAAAVPAQADGRPLIPLGGGRDSAVVCCALESFEPILLSIGGGVGARRVAAALGRDLVVVTRVIDPQIMEMNAAGAPNGHIPVTAITMLVSVIAAACLGAGTVVMANEASASAPTRIVDGTPVNHQHSKSATFEWLLHQALVSVGAPVACFSALRNRSDTDISRVFARRCSRVHSAVVSCNKAGRIDSSRRSDGWCCDCPKCRSVFLSLAPHMAPVELVAMFGADLLGDDSQTTGFADLLDETTKPFECVQTVAEARAAIAELVESPDWSSHVVVGALARHGRTGSRSTSTMLGAHVPERFRIEMDGFFA